MTEVNRPEACEDWIKGDLLEKQGKALKDKCRPAILAFCSAYGSLPDIEYTSFPQTKLLEDKILDWVKEKYPLLSGRVTREALDLEAFETLVKKGEIDYDNLPEDCYETKTIQKLERVKESKK